MSRLSRWSEREECHMKKVLPDHAVEPVKGELLLYQVDEHGPHLEVRLQDESV